MFVLLYRCLGMRLVFVVWFGVWGGGGGGGGLPVANKN